MTAHRSTKTAATHPRKLDKSLSRLVPRKPRIAATTSDEHIAMGGAFERIPAMPEPPRTVIPARVGFRGKGGG